MAVNKRILVLGSSGMLGHVVKRYMKERGHDVVGANRDDFDARNPESVFDLIRRINPKVIVNCVGILNNQNKVQLFGDVNIVFPKLLAGMCNMNKEMKLIHISTNCVFRDKGPHLETEEPTARDLYGLSKAFGEINDNQNLTIRTSIIGPELKKNGCGLFHWFTHTKDKKVIGYSNALWNGVTTLQLAKFINEIINKHITGIINYYTKPHFITKGKLLEHMNEIFGLDKKIIHKVKKGVHSSILAGKHFTNRDYKAQLKDLKEWY